MDVNGDTASLKRKREPKDDPKLSQKKHRRKSKLQENATGEGTTDNAALQNTNGDLELLDTTSRALTRPEKEKLASWKLSKPMGGRMLDIDPVFSPDER